MLLKYGYKEFLRNLGFNFFIIIQIAVVLCTCVFTVSSAEQNLKYYNPLKEYISRAGYYSVISGGFISTDDLEDKRSFSDYSKYIDRVLYSAQLLTLETGNDDYFANKYMHNAYGCNKDVIDLFKPDLADGVWLNEAESPKEGYINAVISKNNYGLKVGDVFQQDFARSSDNITLNIRIVGEIKDGAKIFGIADNHKSDDVLTTEDMFANYYLSYEEIPIVIYNMSELDKYGISSQIMGNVLTIFKDGLTDEELEEAKSDVSKYSSLLVANSDIKSNSLYTVRKNLIVLLPIILGVLLLIIVSILSLTAINTHKQLKNYAVYYVCGGRWRDCAVINLINMGIVLLFSVVFAFLGMLISEKLGWLEQTVVKFGALEALSCGLILLIAILVSLIMPVSIIGKTPPREVIKADE